jgi:uncharacterized protein YndB with AHSA1/START domain
MSTTMPKTDKTPDLVLNRVFNAPPARVFRAWIDPQQMAQWWGPKGYTAPVCELDARPGGAWQVHMQAPDGHVQPMGGTYHEIVAPLDDRPGRIACTTFVKDTAGRYLVEGLHVITFTATPDGKTSLRLESTLLQLAPEWSAARDGMKEGWSTSLDKLEQLVAA